MLLLKCVPSYLYSWLYTPHIVALFKARARNRLWRFRIRDVSALYEDILTRMLCLIKSGCMFLPKLDGDSDVDSWMKWGHLHSRYVYALVHVAIRSSFLPGRIWFKYCGHHVSLQYWLWQQETVAWMKYVGTGRDTFDSCNLSFYILHIIFPYHPQHIVLWLHPRTQCNCHETVPKIPTSGVPAIM